jgi:hypothetical protein
VNPEGGAAELRGTGGTRRPQAAIPIGEARPPRGAEGAPWQPSLLDRATPLMPEMARLSAAPPVPVRPGARPAVSAPLSGDPPPERARAPARAAGPTADPPRGRRRRGPGDG